MSTLQKVNKEVKRKASVGMALSAGACTVGYFLPSLLGGGVLMFLGAVGFFACLGIFFKVGGTSRDTRW